MIKQFVPSQACLKCRGCCRFKEEDSVWSPCLLDEEVLNLAGKEGIPAASLSLGNRLKLVPELESGGFLCPFLEAKSNKCRIYDIRPFECRLYPFLLSMRNKKVLLTIDLNCPYVKEKINTEELKEYTKYLVEYLNSPKQVKMLQDNPQILTAYEDVLALIELESTDAAE
ncbi:MAG: YkgJ family cysteine cluster protein [Candidatus Omnitrophota bacterium]